MESPMQEAYRRLVGVILEEPDDKQTEEHVRNLLASLPPVLQTTDSDGRSPLHHAAASGKLSLLRVLLSFTDASDVDTADGEGCTPLHLASRYGHVTAVHALLRAGASVRCEEAFGETPLHEAARNGHEALVRLFVDGGGAVVDAGNRDASTALHVAARRGHAEVVASLLAAGANPATRDRVGDTPLHDAAREGHAEIAGALLTTGLVGVDERNANGLTPLSVAARHGREAIARSLLERGADVDALSSELCAPLHQAAAEGHDGVARVLIAAGADLDLQDKDDQSALHAAVIFEHAPVVTSLLAVGAQVNLRDVEDCTPLHHAVKNGNTLIVRDLLEAGADPTVLSAGGETPQSLSRVLGKDAVVELFVCPQVVPRQDVTANFRPKKARGPSRPNVEAEIDVCKHFRTTFWCPTSESAFHDLSVWELLYDADTDVKLSPETAVRSSPLTSPPNSSPASPRLGGGASFSSPPLSSMMEGTGDVGARHRQHHRRKTSAHVPEPPTKRWIHLPANNVAWVLDLVQKLSAVDAKTEAECARIMRFVRDTFLEMRFSAPYRKPHFRRESAVASDPSSDIRAASGGTGTAAAEAAGVTAAAGLNSGEMFSLVMPVVDVEMDEKTRERLRGAAGSGVHGGGSRNQAPKRELMRADTAERHRSLSVMPTNLQHYLFPYLKHLDAMDQLRSCFTRSELHVPRSLDQSYHESLSRAEVRSRNESQVVYRYLQRLEEAMMAARASDRDVIAGLNSDGGITNKQQQRLPGQPSSADPFANRDFLSQQSSDKQKRTDGTKEQLMRMAGRQDVASSVRARVKKELKGAQEEQRKQVLMVSQLWMWRIDEHNIITCYPERWDDKNAKTLLNEVKHRILAGQVEKSPQTDMMSIVTQVLSAAASFSDEEFHFQFCGPRSYTNVFASSIAFISNEAMKRYTSFKSSIRGMRTSKTVLRDLRGEIELLQEIDDVREEINMVQRVLNEQEKIVGEFQAAVATDSDYIELEGQKGGTGGISGLPHHTLEFFQRLEMDANRVRDSITTLLDLRQREANIEEALSANEQSKILFIFTGATVVFAPLSWIMGVFEVDIEGLPSPITPGMATLASVGSLLATCAVIWLSLQIYELFAQGGKSSKRQKLDAALSRLYWWGKSTAENKKKTNESESANSSPSSTKSSGPASQTAQSSALRSDTAPSAAGVGGAGHRKLRKRFVWLGRDGRRRLDEETGRLGI